MTAAGPMVTHRTAVVPTVVIALGFIAYCLWTGAIPRRFGEPIERAARPVTYWSCLAAAMCLVAGALAFVL